MISAHTGQYLSVDTAGASPHPAIGFVRPYIVVMRYDVGIAPYIVVVETDKPEKRRIFYIQNKKHTGHPVCFSFVALARGEE